MIIFIPILVILAGVAIVLRRRYLAQRDENSPRVVVKGHTYSEIVESKPTAVEETKRVESVRRCCIIGAGRVGAITAIVLASKNPDVEFCIVDANQRQINAWKSDRPPITEPGLEDLLFDDECLAIERKDPDDAGTGDPSTALVHTKSEPQVGRRQRLKNLSFSSDVHGVVSRSQIVFLCVEMDDSTPSFEYLDPTLKLIAAASTSPKVLVQRSTSPYGVVQHIQNRLKSLSHNTNNNPHTILTNPSFTLPGSSITDSLNPPRVIIGHIYTPDSRPEDIDALKALYKPFVPAEGIVTMDAFSAELGSIVSKAVIAQQMVSLSSVSVLSAGCEASAGAVGWMLGVEHSDDNSSYRSWRGREGVVGLGVEMQEVRRDLKCLVEMARGIGMEEVADYWCAVLRMQEGMYRRAIRGLIMELGAEGEGEKKRVTLLGFEEAREIGAIVANELRCAGLGVYVVGDDVVVKDQAMNEGGVVATRATDEAACTGCSAIVLLGTSGTHTRGWQQIAGGMKERKVLNLGRGLDAVKMKQLGFEML